MSKHLVIVGGGVIGLCSAWYAARNGHRVTIIERGAPDHDGCSLGNAGLIVPSHFIPLAAPGMPGLGLRMMWNPESPFYIRPRLDRDLFDWGWKFLRAANRAHVERASPVLRDLHLASRKEFDELSTMPGNDFGFEAKGLLMLCRTESALHEEMETAEKARRLELAAESLNPDEIARLNPGLDLAIAGGVLFPADCHLSPPRFIAAMTRLLAHHGVTFLWSTELTDWRLDNDGIAAAGTSKGDISGDDYLIAGGSWSSYLTAKLGLKLPMQAGKGYSLTLARPRQKPALGCILVEARLAATPMNGGLRFAGTMEIAGYDDSVNPARIRGIVKAVPHYFPAFDASDFSEIRPWLGLRPCSPDGMPYLGRSRRIPNLIVASGHGMLGLSLGPVTGRLVAEIIDAHPPSVDLELLDPERFT